MFMPTALIIGQPIVIPGYKDVRYRLVNFPESVRDCLDLLDNLITEARDNNHYLFFRDVPPQFIAALVRFGQGGIFNDEWQYSGMIMTKDGRFDKIAWFSSK